MRFDETRDNVTDTEAALIAADAHADTLDHETTWTECQCEACTVDEAEADHIRDSRHIRLVDEPHEEYEDGANGYEDDPEDDGQPSEYEEWQDYFGGDEYYDHSEMGW